MAIKSDVDRSKFTVDSIGAEAHAACMLFDVSACEFANLKEINSIKVKILNDLDTLLSALDASGGHLDEGTRERRMVCWDRFIGPVGRSKNVGLFYIFVLLEGEEVRWKSRRLPADICSNSQHIAGDSPHVQRQQPKNIFSPLQVQQMNMLATTLMPRSASSVSTSSGGVAAPSFESTELLAPVERGSMMLKLVYTRKKDCHFSPLVSKHQ
jgi:hypothetical protein